MNANKKYAKVMYDYLLETLLEQEQYELYIYVLTVLHTGLRPADMIELKWEQFFWDKFVEVKLHKESTIYSREILEDIYIVNSEKYQEKLNAVHVKMRGKMFSYNNKLAITPLLRKHTGTMLYAHDLRLFWGQLMID